MRLFKNELEVGVSTRRAQCSLNGAARTRNGFSAHLFRIFA